MAIVIKRQETETTSTTTSTHTAHFSLHCVWSGECISKAPRQPRRARGAGGVAQSISEAGPLLPPRQGNLRRRSGRPPRYRYRYLVSPIRSEYRGSHHHQPRLPRSLGLGPRMNQRCGRPAAGDFERESPHTTPLFILLRCMSKCLRRKRALSLHGS